MSCLTSKPRSTKITEYVKTEMGKADQLEGKRKGSVGFALTALQRRLASSPEAIFQSLRRRRERPLTVSDLCQDALGHSMKANGTPKKLIGVEQVPGAVTPAQRAAARDSMNARGTMRAAGFGT
jgi:hypothetical protein